VNQSEAIMICRLVKAACPSQAVDTYSPDAWAFMLDDIDYDDAKAAVRYLGRLDLEPGKSRYIEPGHVIAQVKRIRAKRIDDYGPVDPPAGLEPSEYLGWLRATNDAIASGRAPERKQLPTNANGVRRFAALTDGIGRDVGGAA
jgi:hypothetical protein